MALTPHTNATLASIAELMAAHESFVICGHVNPDGDCLGSQLALWHALRSMGKQATCVLAKDEPVGASLSFMPGADDFVAAEGFAGDFEVFVGVDVPNRERIGEAACTLLDRAKTSITIDHHPADAPMCEHVYADPDSASASMIVWELVKMLCVTPPRASAVCAYTGLVTDTGGFRYQNSDVDAFAAATDLVKFGADPADVAAHVFQSKTLASVKLESRVAATMRLSDDGSFAIGHISLEEMDRAGASKPDSESLVDVMRSIEGVRVACMLKEQQSGVRGSLRAKDATDVSVLARQLGGGGHRAAAGFSLDMGLDDACEFMYARIAELLESR